MAMKRMVMEIGMGTDIRGSDQTKAAIRALKDALWHNSLTITQALDLDVNSMQVSVTIGVPNPDQVNSNEVLAVLPHGSGSIEVVQGGLEIPNEQGTDATIIAHAAAVVYVDVA